jgi:hypothetical protein
MEQNTREDIKGEEQYSANKQWMRLEDIDRYR